MKGGSVGEDRGRVGVEGKEEKRGREGGKWGEGGKGIGRGRKC